MYPSVTNTDTRCGAMIALNWLQCFSTEEVVILCPSHPEVLDELGQCNINSAVKRLDLHLQDAHRVAKKKIHASDNAPRIYMEEANQEFDNYQKSLADNSTDTPNEAYKK